MRLSRRDTMKIGGGFLAGLLLPSGTRAAEIIDIEMLGNRDGSKVWFTPVGLLVRPGATIRWTNRDKGNVHTSTAYHPANEDHPRRIPEEAEPWNSDYLLPDQSFSLTLTVPGVYDYYCVPHEHAGMVGRIIVQEEGGLLPEASADNPLPDLGRDPFPSVQDILQEGRIFPS
jgi:plastocyanin